MADEYFRRVAPEPHRAPEFKRAMFGSHLDAVRYVNAIFYLDLLDEFSTWLKVHGAEIIHPPRTVTGGRDLTARHPDGLVVEYFEGAA